MFVALENLGGGGEMKLSKIAWRIQKYKLTTVQVITNESTINHDLMKNVQNCTSKEAS